MLFPYEEERQSITTMFDRYSRFATVNQIVSAVYDQVINTPELDGYA